MEVNSGKLWNTKYQAIFPWHGLWKLAGFSKSFDILIWNIFKTLLWNTAELKKYPRIRYHALLAKRNASFGKNTKFALIAIGLAQFYEFENMTYPCTFQYIERTIWHFWTGFFATCFKFPLSYMTLPGSPDLDPGLQGKPMNSWCVSFETECNQLKCSLIYQVPLKQLIFTLPFFC